MFTTKDKHFAGYNIRGTADQSSFLSRDTVQVHAGVELKQGPCPAPERDPVGWEKAESISFPQQQAVQA